MNSAAVTSLPTTPVIRGDLADLIIENLEKIGVEYIFGVPGGAIEPLYNALARSARRGSIRPIVARHEAGAAFMADGYARETGNIGVCCSTTGPGATNLITGVASAFADNVPMLVITAQTAIPHFGKRALQESSCTAVNTVAMFQSCTRYTSLVSHRGQFESKLISAIVATQGPPAGPAHLSIPMDILSLPRRFRPDEPSPRLDSLIKDRALADLDALEELCEELGKARRVALILGNGCSEGTEHILRFAKLINAPIVTGPSGKRWVDHSNPLYHGVLGFGGHQSANDLIHDPEIDLLLAVGTRFGELVFRGLEGDIEIQKKLIHIDVTSEHFTRSPNARLHVCGTFSSIFRTIIDRVTEAQRWGRTWPSNNLDIKTAPSQVADLPPNVVLNDPESYTSNALPLKPQRLMRELTNRCPPETRFVIDAGNSWAWGTHYLFTKESGKYRIGMGFGAMAWAIGAAVGTSFGCLDKPVVCICGDGSFLMSGQEITVAVADKLSVIFVVLNDHALGMVKHGQRLGGGEQVAFELPPVNFADMAIAMGAQGIEVVTIEDLEALDFAAMAAHPGPTLLDVYIDPEEVPSMGARMKALGRQTIPTGD